MKWIWRNRKGMVTVMVTLLLIPSVLVSGTAVDSARIYAARSVVQDANQLAANSVLASYDAMLQDLYGLYGVMESDDELASLIDEYIKIAVFGQENRSLGMGTFQLTYGSNLQPGAVTAAANQNLGNTEVLRRQIEEYAKFRAPVILVDQILDKLDNFKKIKEDAEVIQKKMEIDKGIEELSKIYKELYDLIQELNKCPEKEDEIIRKVNSCFGEIKAQLDKMNIIKMFSDSERRDDLSYEERIDMSVHYNGHCDNIAAIVKGGTIVSRWEKGYEGKVEEPDEEPDWIPGKFENETRLSYEESLEGILEEGRKTLTEDYLNKLDTLVEKCRAVDLKKEDLEKKIDDLEQKLEDNKCSEQLKASMTKAETVMTVRSADGTSREESVSQLVYYRRLLGYNVTAMGEAMRDKNAPQIRALLEKLDPENIFYGKQGEVRGEPAVRLSLDEMKGLKGNHPINHAWEQLESLAKLEPDEYCIKIEEIGTFEQFQSEAFNTTENPKFYKVLEGLWGVTEDAKKKAVKQAITKIFKKAQETFGDIVNDLPAGAINYKPNKETNLPEEDTSLETKFGTEGNWGNEDEGLNSTTKALNSNIIARLGKVTDRSVNKLLLLTYDSEMFSNFTTKKDGSQKTMSGIPLSTDVNYFLQSEMEYLCIGYLKNAKVNLIAVSGMILLTRFVFDYAASFQVSSVNETITIVKGLLSFSGPLAIALGELTRVALSLGEAANDVKRLRSGEEVAFLKDDSTWKFSVRGLANDAVGELIFLEDSSNKKDQGLTLNYKNYLQVFLLLVSDTQLAERTQKLIELNLTNKKNGIGGKGDRPAREAAMTAATLEELSQAKTGFTVTTTLDLRMLFLSMPMARQGVNGKVPPGTVQVTVTDYRGY